MCKDTLNKIIMRHPGSEVHTDGWRAYRWLELHRVQGPHTEFHQDWGGGCLKIQHPIDVCSLYMVPIINHECALSASAQVLGSQLLPFPLALLRLRSKVATNA